MANFVSVDTSRFNVDKATRNMKKTIDRGIANGMDELAGKIKIKLIEYMTSYGLGGSDLMNHIVVKKLRDGILINVGGEYASFVEFGTGIVGSENPHPQPKDWIYDVNAHGDRGWFYPTTESDPNPWKHTYNGQLYGWTKGQASRPFMYKTWLWATRSATQIIKKNIRAEIRKVGGK